MRLISQIPILAIAALLCSSCTEKTQTAIDPDYQALSGTRVICQPPSQAMLEPWGKSGASDGCYIKDGPFVTAEGGHIRIRGEFTNGVKSGNWQYFSEEGRVLKEVDHGSPISD